MRALFILLFVAITLPAAAQTYEELTERAMAAVEQDSLVQAQQYIQEALRLEPANPRNALLFSNLGTIQRRQHQYYMALDSYTLALALSPCNVPVLLNRAALYMELGKEEMARIDYSLALDVDKKNQEALLMRAYIYMRQRNFPFSRADYESLLRLAPQSYEGRFGLAMLSQAEEKFEESLAIIDAMLAEGRGETPTLTPQQTAELYVARAGVGMDMKQEAQALLDLEQSISICPSQPEAYMMRGQIYLAQNKKSLAKLDFEQAAALGIPLSELRSLLIQCK